MYKEEQVIEELLVVINNTNKEGYVSLADIATVGNKWLALQGKPRRMLRDVMGSKETKELIDTYDPYGLKPQTKIAARSTGKHTVGTQTIARHVASKYCMGFYLSLLR
jgi:hypothetical protein